MLIKLRNCLLSVMSKIVGVLAGIWLFWPLNVIVFWPLCKLLKINLQQAQHNLSDYHTFQAVFCRQLKPNSRPIAASTWVSPVDGKLIECSDITSNLTTCIKGIEYNLKDILNTTKIPQNGCCLLFYLAPDDYHHFAMPTTTTVTSISEIAGQVYSVNPTLLNWFPTVYKENERVVLTCKSSNKLWYMVPVAALNVGQIELPWVTQTGGQQSSFQTGQLCGNFKMGSSVLLVIPDLKATDCLIPLNHNVVLGQALFK